MFEHMGSISHGTMRPEDLIPVFLEVLEDIDPLTYTHFWNDPYLYCVRRRIAQSWEDICLQCPDECEYLLEDLFIALEEQAPPETYFGAHSGDGSDYGFWAND